MGVVGFIIEFVVAVLLAFTVGYCILLDRRLQRLRADEKGMRQTVVDLGLATERAERAIDGLRHVLAECDRTLGDRLRAAEGASVELDAAVRSGDEVLERIGRIVSTARRAVADAEGRPQAEVVGNVSETVAAAEAFAARARRRITGAAA